MKKNTNLIGHWLSRRTAHAWGKPETSNTVKNRIN